MVRLRSRRWLAHLRVLVLGLVGLGLVLQPVMATIGEVHEWAHDVQGEHEHDPKAGELASDLVVLGEQGEAGVATLFVLLHFAHCCGATAALPPLLEPVTAILVPDRPAMATVAARPAAPQPSPFKPPIFG